MLRYGMPEGIDTETANIALILNLFLPGVGTMIVGFAAKPCSKKTALVAILQIILIPIVLGWIWAILWAYLLLRKAEDEADEAAAHPPQLFNNHPLPHPPPVAKQADP